MEFYYEPSTSTTAMAKARGASCGRLCPTPPLMSRCAYLPEPGSLPRRLFDQSRNVGRVREERDVTRLDLGRFRSHALRVESLQVGIDGAIVLRDQVPRRDGLPRRLVRRCAEHAANDRLLCRGKDARLRLGHISGKDRMELRGVDVQKPGFIGPERRAQRDRILVAERADRLADLGR